MEFKDISLSDRYDLKKDHILLNGTQALVRLMLMQKVRDKHDGLNTAGFVTGYRGSPMGAVDFQMEKASKNLSKNDIVFQPGLNEDLAATALWGAQQAELRQEGKFDGVFGLWYGKGPGVDRSGDVMRHANMAGTSQHGGVLMAMGDDHTGESSTTLHQSDFALIDAMMPILSPAGVQEILDYGLIGIAMSRFAGVWVGLKCIKDTIEVTSVVNGDPERLKISKPKIDEPDGGLNIRLIDLPITQEERLHNYKRVAAEKFARENNLDRNIHGKSDAKIGFVAAGKNWLDLAHSMELLGLDEEECNRIGLKTYKIGMIWPLDTETFIEWSKGLDLIVVVEEKRKILEPQIKEAIFDSKMSCRVLGFKGEDGGVLFPTEYAIDPIMISQKIGKILCDEGRQSEQLLAALDSLNEASKADNSPELATRTPYFCSGCPHNTSTKVPDGSRAYAGIGCHFMVQWMDRDTLGFTHMGGEGANWIGEAPFSERSHVFQNLGDGTYNHSGIQAIRAAISANTTITYKLLFNDAVAMTGGQGNDGNLDAYKVVNELYAFGIKNLAVVYDEKEDININLFPKGIEIKERNELINVENKFKELSGVSAIVYIQTCAAEKRRRRKRGKFPDPDKRIIINPAVCEGCGDCGIQSNCVSIVPVETKFGRKREIDQSSCNKDFSCVKGFCPSFVTVEGGKLKKEVAKNFSIPKLPNPTLPEINGTYNIVITGIGGTGVVTIGALLAMASHLDNKGAGMMEMAGLAQKGGAVSIHCRISEKPEDINAIRVATGEADAVIGGDLVTTGGQKTLNLMQDGRTKAIVNEHETITGDFTRDGKFSIPSDSLLLAISAKIGERNLSYFDFSEISRKMLADSIYANTMILGAAWQMGIVPLSKAALHKAIDLNGAYVEQNIQAFELGRLIIVDPSFMKDAVDKKFTNSPATSESKLSNYFEHIEKYQDKNLVKKFKSVIGKIEDPELKDIVLQSYHKVLTYKDEYEVARLHLDMVRNKLRTQFSEFKKLSFHLAPPLFGGSGPDGRPVKREFGSWVLIVFKVLAALKFLRKTRFDPFRYSSDRKLERSLLKQFENDLDIYGRMALTEKKDLVAELFSLPLNIKGFGIVKEKAYEVAQLRRKELIMAINEKSSEKIAAE